MIARLAFLALAFPATLLAESSIVITDRAVVFRHTGTDPGDPANTSGYNFGPSIAALPD